MEKEKPTLRQIMMQQIKAYSWCSSTWKYQVKDTPFEEWLNSLDDDDFLMEYNSTREIFNNLD